MILAYIYLDNIYGFKDFSASFVYPKKIVNNPLGQEYLKNYPNFRYKKVNIIFGSNATGKTTLGKAIWNICLFLNCGRLIVLVRTDFIMVYLIHVGNYHCLVFLLVCSCSLI